MNVNKALAIIKEKPETHIWELKLLVNPYFEDDFDEPKPDDRESDEELEDHQISLLKLVQREIPDLRVKITNKKFKKRGLRHLIELESEKRKDNQAIQSIDDLEEREYTANDEVPFIAHSKNDFTWIKELGDA